MNIDLLVIFDIPGFIDERTHELVCDRAELERKLKRFGFSMLVLSDPDLCAIRALEIRDRRILRFRIGPKIVDIDSSIF